MAYKKLIPIIFLKNEKAYLTSDCDALISIATPVEIAMKYSENGADEIIIIDLSYDDDSHEKAINMIRQISKTIDIPLIVGGNVKRVEDVKKYLYAGASIALLEDCKESNLLMMKEVVDRFGKSKIGLWFANVDEESINLASDNQVSCILVSNIDNNSINSIDFAGIPAIVSAEDNIQELLEKDFVLGVTGPFVSVPNYDFMASKQALTDIGIRMNTFKSAIPFVDFKLNSDGLIPVIVQDYKTDEVLMLAYMNKEAYDKTISTGRMSYFSRSRQELWIKGLTSGHYQYVKSIEIDCDNDTLLAKVKQIGAACHTGNRSCFYRNLVSSSYAQTNPLKVFNDVMSVIEDRKLHPKEGSYTNYLFDKGIDKILKKVGEEATEIIIAAKNPDAEEIKYEISDFLYHVMVLMVLRDVSWEDIVKELANR
ncbi:bifunctional phosphoribosyl-AMP cyclohydrolase/phosphoribosyl-ATP diphosphatase HisIE [[Clostridium] fimetarium]|uniref:Histidine biosynthesis bifunctional protein HisIE n=1 Tax=[Clostridium] fimetarium TaxID=99656 RepID=A0A1I0RHI5_9FIRM|nr:bifunctional phosphoribosyl-AMP cyclohydrolase/phosphoribosyl-ATP diphosphatase HisIE [[Clostridium] fimetarium]SEW40380.1 phosphoribosyl-ATP pyrophosphohydrolase / phosphoribosyl-AMP cyclohydrolase [[Clostridium] fimetarium]